ncbi:MAG: amidase [Alphaproteobacteria bacterium]
MSETGSADAGAPALALGAAIERGAANPIEIAEQALARIGTLDPEHRIFVHLLPERTRAEAHAAWQRAKAGLRRGPLDGVPIAWKDNVETGGAVTAAGSRLLQNHVPDRDAPVLSRATLAGAVFLGKTNLTEIAFSGLGINPVTGTPANAFDATTPRVPGGSSSGTAVAIARGLCPLGVGTDTGGSVRIPAAWNNLVGLKTTAGLIPTDGIVPLVPSLDTVGPLATCVVDAAALHAVLAGQKPVDLAGSRIAGRRILALPAEALSAVETSVLAPYEAALEALSKAGAQVMRGRFAPFDVLRGLARKHGVPGVPEASAVWRDAVEARPSEMYRFVANRIAEADGGTAIGLAGYLAELRQVARDAADRLAGGLAVALPTTAARPAPIADLEHDEAAYTAANRSALMLTSPANGLGLCAISIPAGFTAPDGTAPALPVGLQLVAGPGGEAALLRLAVAAEAVLSR